MAEFASRQAQIESSYLLSPARPERRAQEPVHAPDPLVVQQQALGNQAMQRLANQCPLKLPTPALCPTGGACHACPATLQAKLTVNEPGDPHEQEADRIAEDVVRQPGPLAGAQPIQRQCQDCDEEVHRQPAALEEEEEEETPVQAKPVAGAITPLVQRQTEPVEEEEEEQVQAKRIPGEAPQVTPAVQAQVSALRGGGQPLPGPLRSFFEPRLGHDFRGVRLHTDARAATTAQAVRARAFTVGRDVVFDSGQYAPETADGQKLLAHELAHVIQQAGRGAALPEVQRQARPRRVALSHVGRCANPRRIAEAIPAAKDMMWTANLWFLSHSDRDRARVNQLLRLNFGSDLDEVRTAAQQVLINAHAALRAAESGEVTFRCEPERRPRGRQRDTDTSEPEEDLCAGWSAYVVRGEGMVVHICPSFFRLGLEDRRWQLLHEFSHFGGAWDDTVRRVMFAPVNEADCAGAAGVTNPRVALHNADSYARLVWCLTRRVAPAARPGTAVP